MITSLLLAATGTAGLVPLLIWLLVFVIVAAIVFWIVRSIPLPQPWANIAVAIVALILLLVLLGQLGVF
jgi:hypothetical protein